MYKTLMLAVFMVSAAACTPTVKLEAPEKPIEINLNVKIEQHIKVEIDKDVQDAMKRNQDIF